MRRRATWSGGGLASVCAYCRLHQEHSELIHHVEHIVAKQHGGSDDPDNPALACHRCNLHNQPEAVQYLQRRGLQDSALLEQLGLGYAPGGNLRRHLAGLGYSLEQLLEVGLITPQMAVEFELIEGGRVGQQLGNGLRARHRGQFLLQRGHTLSEGQRLEEFDEADQVAARPQPWQ